MGGVALRSMAINPRSANGPRRLALVVATVGATHVAWRQGRRAAPRLVAAANDREPFPPDKPHRND
jgi:hypothetical protein